MFQQSSVLWRGSGQTGKQKLSCCTRGFWEFICAVWGVHHLPLPLLLPCLPHWGGSVPLVLHLSAEFAVTLKLQVYISALRPWDFYSCWDLSVITAQMVVMLSLYRWYSFVQQHESYSFPEYQHLRAPDYLLAVRAVKHLPSLVWCWLFYHLRVWVCPARVFLGSVFSDSHPERLPIAALSKIFFVWKYWTALWISRLIIYAALRRSFKL